jgi:hypothetical protein
MEQNKIRKLLTLDDLCDYYANHKNIVSYSADKNNGTPVVVQLEGTMTFSDDDYDPETGLLKTHLKSCHIGTNRNHSNIEQDVMEEAKSSIYNRPILGFIHKLSDDTYDFAGHEMFINEDGEIEYEEIPVGCIPESGNAHLVYDEDKDKTYLEVDGVVFEEYTRAASILKEKKESKVSVELALLDYSYNPKDKEMIISRFYFSGITILGKDRYTEKPIEEGMYGSKITLKDFKQNNSMFSNLSEQENSKLIDTLEKLNNTLSNLNINQNENSNENYGKEENDNVEDNILVNEEVTEESTVESTEETKVEEEVTKTESTEEVTETVTENESEETVENTPDVVETEAKKKKCEEESNENSDSEEVKENESTEEVFETIEKTFEIDGKKFYVSFELSHEDIRYGLYSLIADYEEIDNDWYDVRAVYDDYFVFQGWFSNKIYGQKYTKDGDTVALDGERYTLHEELLTDSELAQLNDMRSSYSSIQKELNSYKESELNAQREAVFADENYAEFIETEGFKKIKENISTYSVEDLRTACDLEFAKCVKAKGNFALNHEEEKPKAPMFAFGKVEQKSSFLDGLLKKDTK